MMMLTVVFTITALTAMEWVLIWGAMEASLLAICPILMSMSAASNEATLKYFIVQTFSGLILLLAVVSAETMGALFLFALVFKMGLMPAHFWVLPVFTGLDYFSIFLISSMMKTPGLLLASYVSELSIWLVSATSILVSGPLGACTSNIKKLLAWSSIGHSGWVFMMTPSDTHWWQYFCIYTIALMFFIMSLWLLAAGSINHLSQITQPSTKLTMLVLSLSLAGVPPFAGFAGKWVALSFVFNQYWLMGVVLVVALAITIFFYVQMIMHTLTTISAQMNKAPATPIFTILASLSLIGLALFMLIYYRLKSALSMISWIYYTTTFLCMLLAVPFYTLYERKILSEAHIRRGPEIVSIWGLLQPMADAIKLFTKEHLPPATTNYILFAVCPLIMLTLALLSWAVVPYASLVFNFKFFILVFFIITSISVYSHLGSGWSSNSNYASIGALRCIAQSLSYEVSLAFLLLVAALMVKTLDTLEWARSQPSLIATLSVWPVASLWWLSSIAETNRTPFDFAEGESELVSGFNVEYGSGWFAFMFMAEYMSMMFMCVMVTILFLGNSMLSPLGMTIIFILMFTYIWVRASYPRTRYDKLMYFSWLMVLPISLLYMLTKIGVN